MTETQFTHLADIGFRRIAPTAALRPFVQWYWSIHSHGPIHTQRDEFMHPDGSSGLVFNWGDVLQLDRGYYAQSVTLDRVGTRSRRLKVAGCIEAFGILFRPAGAFSVFGVPMDELSETAVLAAHLAPSQLIQLYEQLYQAPSVLEKVALSETWLRHQLQQRSALSPVIRPSLELITQMQGQLSIEQVANTVHVSTRQLQRLYQTQVGLSPKKFARMMRVRQARTALKQMSGYSAVDVAYTHGFYDQPHFVHEFKSVVGMTPGAYSRRRRAVDHTLSSSK